MEERNTRTFEGDERSIHELKLFFLQTLLEWANASGVVTFMSLPDMLHFCLDFFLCCLFALCCVPLIFFSFRSFSYLMKFITHQKRKKKFSFFFISQKKSKFKQCKKHANKL